LDYFVPVKWTHVGAVIITATFFIVRGIWMLQESALLQHPFVRIAPHVNDTVLFVSALVLATMVGQYPFVTGWLTAKVLGLVVYIVLGHIALRRGQTRTQRSMAFAGALGVLAYILAVARCRDALACLGS
jgi:uncharacterized membrane protein SirB2